ncbi:hypothetical protein ABMB67_001903 [Halalkalibacter oceani]
MGAPSLKAYGESGTAAPLLQAKWNEIPLSRYYDAYLRKNRNEIPQLSQNKRNSLLVIANSGRWFLSSWKKGAETSIAERGS